MTRYYPNMKMSFAAVVRVDGVETDAAETIFYYKIGKHGTETMIIPERIAPGTYIVVLQPNKSGHLYYRWDTDGDLDVASEGVVNIARSSFEEAA